MSSASPFHRSRPRSGPRPGVGRLGTLLTHSARCVGFWSAVVIPFVLLGLVVAGSAVEHAGALGALLAANVLALRLGHDYRRD